VPASTRARDYLTKPSRSPRWGTAARARSPRASERPPSSRSRLRLDPQTQRVWRGEVELALPNKELRFSSSSSPTGQVLSRFQLLEHAWDMAYDTARTSSPCTPSPAERIDRPFGRSSIRDRGGAGYRMPARRRMTASRSGPSDARSFATGWLGAAATDRAYNRLAASLDRTLDQRPARRAADVAALVTQRHGVARPKPGSSACRARLRAGADGRGRIFDQTPGLPRTPC